MRLMNPRGNSVEELHSRKSSLHEGLIRGKQISRRLSHRQRADVKKHLRWHFPGFSGTQSWSYIMRGKGSSVRPWWSGANRFDGVFKTLHCRYAKVNRCRARAFWSARRHEPLRRARLHTQRNYVLRRWGLSRRSPLGARGSYHQSVVLGLLSQRHDSHQSREWESLWI